MKISLKVCGAICAAIMLIGCGSTPQNDSPKTTTEPAPVVVSTTKATTAPKVSKRVTREIIDSKGMAVGAPTPNWVIDAVEGDYTKLGSYPEFKGKTLYLAEDQGKNLDLLKSWVRNFEVSGSFSKTISNSVMAKFGGSLEGDNLEERKSYLNEIVASFSKTTFSGLELSKDYWVETRVYDKDNDSYNDIYQYFVIYTIDSKDLREQLDVALGKVEAKTEEQNRMREEVRAAMKEVQLYSEGK